MIEEISNINDKAQVRKVSSCKTVISSVAVDGDINVLCGVVGGAENGDKRVGGGVERRADWANRCELLTQSPNMKPNISPGEILSHPPLNQI